MSQKSLFIINLGSNDFIDIIKGEFDNLKENKIVNLRIDDYVENHLPYCLESAKLVSQSFNLEELEDLKKNPCELKKIHEIGENLTKLYQVYLKQFDEVFQLKLKDQIEKENHIMFKTNGDYCLGRLFDLIPKDKYFIVLIYPCLSKQDMINQEILRFLERSIEIIPKLSENFSEYLEQDNLNSIRLLEPGESNNIQSEIVKHMSELDLILFHDNKVNYLFSKDNKEVYKDYKKCVREFSEILNQEIQQELKVFCKKLYKKSSFSKMYKTYYLAKFNRKKL